MDMEAEASNQQLLAVAVLLANRSPVIGGSRPGKSPNLNRNRELGEATLFADYFADAPVYGQVHFNRRFRICRNRFNDIMRAIEAHGLTTQRRDATGLLGASVRLKMTAALRVLAYGAAYDAYDEYLRLSETSICDALKAFCVAVITIYAAEYTRLPTRVELARILRVNTDRGFPGMLGSVDCKHWKWDNCPRAWAGQFKGKEDKPSIVLEAVATEDLRIWHYYFGTPGSLNDLNVLDRSPLLDAMTSTDSVFNHSYTIHDTTFSRVYLLGDGIYRRWACIAKPVGAPTTAKQRHYTQKHAAVRKDVERTFGVLDGKWRVIRYPARFLNPDFMALVMQTCIILHNMNVVDRVHEYINEEPEHPSTATSLGDRVDALREVIDSDTHDDLRRCLTEHLWEARGLQPDLGTVLDDESVESDGDM
eukprot:GHVU01233084.1.p1 GENE.GHVU01233084.1~~GHVU01233084.1.p1  ORF type:complete len:421 (+),score=42.04 GHVU01233084.1:2-1264(+)